MHFPQSVLQFPTGATDFRVSNDGAPAAVLLVVLRAAVSVQVESRVPVLKVKLGFPIESAVYGLAFTLNLPVVSTVAVALVTEGADFLSATDGGGEVAVGV